MHMQPFYDACAESTPPLAKTLEKYLCEQEPECGYSPEGYDETVARWYAKVAAE